MSPEAKAIALAATYIVADFHNGQPPDPNKDVICTTTKVLIDGVWQIIGYGVWTQVGQVASTARAFGDYAVWSAVAGEEGWVTAFPEMFKDKLLQPSRSLTNQFGPGNVVIESIGCNQVAPPPPTNLTVPRP